MTDSEIIQELRDDLEDLQGVERERDLALRTLRLLAEAAEGNRESRQLLAVWWETAQADVDTIVAALLLSEGLQSLADGLQTEVDDLEKRGNTLENRLIALEKAVGISD